MRARAGAEITDAGLIMFDLLLADCRLATMDTRYGSYGAIEGAALAIKDGKIAWLGEEKDLPSRQARAYRILDGAWVTPGLIDCHTHFIFGGNRIGDFEARNSGKEYTTIAKEGGGILATMRATRAASKEKLVQNASRRLRPFLQEGVTTMEIKSGYGLSLQDEQKMLEAATQLGRLHGLTVVRTFLGAHSLPPEYADSKDRYIQTVAEDWLPALAQEGLVDAVDGFCEEIAFNPQQIERLFQKAREMHIPIKLHAEQLSHFGGTRLAAKYGALSADHLEYAKEEDIAAMARAGTSAVLLPGAFYALRETQLPPLDRLRQYKVPISIASDHNPGTSPLSSLLPCLNLAVTCFRMTPEEALAGVTLHAARALGLKDRGILRQGLLADLALWHIENPSELSYWIGSQSCALRIKEGRIDDSPLI